jgi:probable rRNA maturation factor
MPEIINNQRKFKLKWQVFQDFAEVAIVKIQEAKDKNFDVAFVSDRRLRKINKQFRGKNSTTDVLSFAFEADEFDIAAEQISDKNKSSLDFLGDIVISIEQAQKQACENDLDLETEIKQLILHGILHLCGYDHESDDGEMNRRELELREILKI